MQRLAGSAWPAAAAQFKAGKFRRWLFTIARNEFLDTIRRRRVRTEVGLLDGDGALLNEPFEENERLIAMRECLQQIDGDFVAAIVKVKLEGVPVEEIAREENVSEGAVYTRVHRGAKQLRECIEKKLEGRP